MAQGKGIFKEFEQFALRGNVVDLAVGVIVGAAFGKIVDSLGQRYCDANRQFFGRRLSGFQQ